jgi:hypothetical protein
MIRFSPALLLVGACLSCSVSRDEVSRVGSPSGRVDAILVESNGGATTPFVYFVYVVPRGAAAPERGEVARLIAATRNDQAWGANLRWAGQEQLLVEYRDARDVQQAKDAVILGIDSIRVTLQSGVVDPAAPAGGMLFNLGRVRR